MRFYSKLTDFKRVEQHSWSHITSAPSALPPLALAQASGCTVSRVLVGYHQQFLRNEIAVNVAAVTLDKTLFKQAVNSPRYTRSYLSSTQPPATSPGVCTSSGSVFLWDEPLGREIGYAKQTCIALLMQAESEVIDSLGFLIHVCSVLPGWLGPEAMELEWMCVMRWLEQLRARFSAMQ